MNQLQLEPIVVDAQHHAAIQQVLMALRELRFGTVNIIVQDGVVVQIERTEKHRLRSTDCREPRSA